MMRWNRIDEHNDLVFPLLSSILKREQNGMISLQYLFTCCMENISLKMIYKSENWYRDKT